jgi:hypothetical protein
MEPTSASVLATLTQERLLDVSRAFGIGLRSSYGSKAELVDTLGARLAGQFPALLREMGRDELRGACRAHGLQDDGRARRALQERLLEAAGFDPAKSAAPPADYHGAGLPSPGQVVHARHRQWLVERVERGEAGESPKVHMVCLDDDSPGRPVAMLWDLELGARVVTPEQEGLGEVKRIDPPGHFGAYLHALKWSAVSAADANRFQAPFRAGIKIMNHQLTPLMKALELPRANLFIADDVGLGKTIEAGLVLQELLLRQQADFVLIACPASIALQWKSEMQRRFGLRFEVMTRQFIARRRQERGFGVNPWATHNRFIISHQVLRRPDYLDPLLNHLGPRARKGLLILDEAHVAAPSSRSKYAVDSDTTRTIRDLAPRFDNRLFLSATPHNGHSNSFSALLEILDPIRFTRGVPIDDARALAPVMVRRLKRDLRKIGTDRYPRRMLVQLSLRHDGTQWSCEEARYDAETNEHEDGPTLGLGGEQPSELNLATQLARYTSLCSPKKGRGRLAFIRLQQRLLSSPEAFARSLEAHTNSMAKKGGVQVHVDHLQTDLDLDGADPETYGERDEAHDAEHDADIAAASSELQRPTAEAEALLASMRETAERFRREPDAKMLALFAWMREHLCPSIGLGHKPGVSAAWTGTRVILFTEWADTKRYIVELLRQALAHTDGGADRVMVFHGGMGDEARDEVQRAFNAPPNQHPVRILVATDAAREGINLQGHCADLFHIDLPWNPGRLEQRNGRIDRTLQESPDVRCHYFVYPDRAEDHVLATLVRKVDIVQRELGSLGAVLFDDVSSILENGIDATTAARIEAVGRDAQRSTVTNELEAQRKDLQALEDEVARAGKILDDSKKALEVSPESLKGVVEIGLKMAGMGALEPTGTTSDGRPTYRLPKFPPGWSHTVDTLRPMRKRDETFLDWRRRPPREVSFSPLQRLSEEVEQLHLAHPLVKRVLDRFLAQGFSAHDLSRVTAVVAPDDSVVRVVAYGRLSLFGPGAVRLHDEIISVAAPWRGQELALDPYRDRATATKTIAQVEQLLAQGASEPGAITKERILKAAPALYASLWPVLAEEADARGASAKNGLINRARKESDELRSLIERQMVALSKRIGELKQMPLPEVLSGVHKDEARQMQLDQDHMEQRAAVIDAELASEPAAVAALYDVRMTRVSPIGLVVSWPEART